MSTLDRTHKRENRWGCWKGGPKRPNRCSFSASVPQVFCDGRKKWEPFLEPTSPVFSGLPPFLAGSWLFSVPGRGKKQQPRVPASPGFQDRPPAPPARLSDGLHLTIDSDTSASPFDPSDRSEDHAVSTWASLSAGQNGLNSLF